MITTVKTSSVVQGMPKYRSMLAGNPAYTPPSFESIATATGTGSSGTITFSSIPSTFKHLQIRGIARSNESGATETNLRVRFNSDTGTNYARHILKGDGASATANGAASQANMFIGEATGASSGTNTMSAVLVDILDYGSTSKNKTIRNFVAHDNNGSGMVHISSGLWMSTNAVTSIELVFTNGSSFTTATTFALYGIKEF